MARRLESLIVPFLSLSPQEQLERIRSIRSRKFEERPAAKQHKAKARKPIVNQIRHTLGDMSKEEQEEVLRRFRRE